MKRRLISALTVAMIATTTLSGFYNQSMTATTFAATAATAASDKPITFPLPAKKTFKLVGMYFEGQSPKMSENGFFKDFEAHTNVKIDWVDIPNTSKIEKVNLMLAGADLPDGFYGQWTVEEGSVNTYKSQGYFMQLTDDLLNKYAPDYMKFLSYDPEWKKSVAFPDGKVYSLFKAEISPYNSTVNDTIVVNRDWLNKLNLKAPTTTDELKALLLAFKKGGDLNGDGTANEIPFSFMASKPHHQTALASFMGIFGTPTRLIRM